MKTAAIITPSKIWDNERTNYASAAMQSMRQADIRLPHYVVDDSPPKNKDAAKRIYKDAKFVDGGGADMTNALLMAARMARNDGIKLIFIHLDDQFYIPYCQRLMTWAIDAMTKENDLKIVPLSGFPLLNSDCTKESGNRTHLSIGNKVSFEHVSLNPIRYDEYTLWISPLEKEMILRRFWPLILWFTFYDIDFLTDALVRFQTQTPASNTLGKAELFYKEPKNWNLLTKQGGKIGYINMQFGGFEMQRNKNFMELLNLPNESVR